MPTRRKFLCALAVLPPALPAIVQAAAAPRPPAWKASCAGVKAALQSGRTDLAGPPLDFRAIEEMVFKLKRHRQRSWTEHVDALFYGTAQEFEKFQETLRNCLFDESSHFLNGRDSPLQELLQARSKT